MNVTVLKEGVSYFQADGTIRLASIVRGVTTTTRSFPARYEAIVGLASDPGGGFGRVVMVLTRFGEGQGDDLRIGVRSVTVEWVDSDGEPLPMPSDLVSSILVHTLAVRALKIWSYNDDHSPVTTGQARELLRAARVAEGAEDRWRRASHAYLQAKATGEPTTEAVVRELGFSHSDDPAAAARQMVARAAAKGVLAQVADELDLAHLLTAKQRRAPEVSA